MSSYAVARLLHSLAKQSALSLVSCLIAGYSQYAAAAAAASTGVFPHMSSAFSLFPPPSGMFPTSSALPFGGLGSLSDPALLSAPTPALDSATGKSLSILIFLALERLCSKCRNIEY